MHHLTGRCHSPKHPSRLHIKTKHGETSARTSAPAVLIRDHAMDCCPRSQCRCCQLPWVAARWLQGLERSLEREWSVEVLPEVTDSGLRVGAFRCKEAATSASMGALLAKVEVVSESRALRRVHTACQGAWVERALSHPARSTALTLTSGEEKAWTGSAPNRLPKVKDGQAFSLSRSPLQMLWGRPCPSAPQQLVVSVPRRPPMSSPPQHTSS